MTLSPNPPFWILFIGISKKCLSRMPGYWETTKFLEPTDTLSGCLSFSTPWPPRTFQALWEYLFPSSALQSSCPKHDPGPACVNSLAWSENAKPRKENPKAVCYLALSTHHNLCSKHVFVPKLKVSHFLKDHFLVLPRLEEVCTSENCRVTRGFMPFNVYGVWLIIGINSPGKKKQLLS